jgi:hypothetical protein
MRVEDPDMRPPHPDLRLRKLDGRFEVRIDGLDRPIVRGQALHDGTWVVAIRELQNGPERAAIVPNETAALTLVRPWARKHAWTYRPNAGKGAPMAQQPWPTGKILPCDAATSD